MIPKHSNRQRKLKLVFGKLSHRHLNVQINLVLRHYYNFLKNQVLCPPNQDLRVSLSAQNYLKIGDREGGTTKQSTVSNSASWHRLKLSGKARAGARCGWACGATNRGGLDNTRRERRVGHRASTRESYRGRAGVGLCGGVVRVENTSLVSIFPFKQKWKAELTHR